MIALRPYQQRLADGIHQAWAAGSPNVMAVQATRTGKTVVFTHLMQQEPGYSIAIAHRQELIAQTSLSLARAGIMHRIIAPDDLIKQIINVHTQQFMKCYVDPRAPRIVSAVKTLLSRKDSLAPLLQRVALWIIDEGHHVLEGNEWGKAAALFPNARGLAVTATPDRADGRGLGRHADGLMDTMVVGLQMREAIDEGWLLDYRIFAPAGDYVRPGSGSVGKDGELKRNAVKASIRKSHIVGDAVAHYQKIIPGKKAVVYNADIETATETAAAFNQAGIPAEVVSSKTDQTLRSVIMARFERGEVLIVCNVDLFGEGTDMPDLDAVIMMRPTESFSLYCQQFNRASTVSLPGGIPEDRDARLAAIAASDKPHAIIIDHVGNVTRHGLPDARTTWTLDARDKRSRGGADDAIPLRNCLNPECMQVYERVHPECPYCGHHPVPSSRSAPEFVDGDLTELDPATLAAMRGEVARVDMSAEEYRAGLVAKRCPPAGLNSNVKHHVARQDAQQALRASMAWWAGHHKVLGRSDAESYRRFYHAFGVDALSAQALGLEDAYQLAERINNQLIKMGG